ncbi:hypothetical protein [Riemerella columbina]|uniref:hypothetical protein n=1 Tax=Riemerella columbina TaxID=103810 RepID=UPI00266F7525|nr:hypothetical protein [Riemerella columbina]WKS95315.1 hypothetical protein NYR17_00830 [Riemerella columbina]
MSTTDFKVFSFIFNENEIKASRLKKIVKALGGKNIKVAEGIPAELQRRIDEEKEERKNNALTQVNLKELWKDVK